jgi:hypothetical protein
MRAKILAIMAPPARTGRHEALGGIKFTLANGISPYAIMLYEVFHDVLNSRVDHRRNKTGNVHLP